MFIDNKITASKKSTQLKQLFASTNKLLNEKIKTKKTKIGKLVA